MVLSKIFKELNHNIYIISFGRLIYNDLFDADWNILGGSLSILLTRAIV